MRRRELWAAGLLSAALLAVCIGWRVDAQQQVSGTMPGQSAGAPVSSGSMPDKSAEAGTTETETGTSAFDPEMALENGRLVVWVVRPAPPGVGNVQEAGVPAFRAPTPGYHEQTVGNFGQNAAGYGTTAGNYGVDASSETISVPKAAESPGSAPAPNTPEWRQYHEQTSGSFGQTSGSYGTNAGDHGEAVGSLGQDAGTYGTDAGDVGQAVGSFGNSLSTIADAGNPQATAAEAAKESRSAMREELEQRLRAAYPDLQVEFVELGADELKARLATTSRGEYPDVLVGALPEEWWSGLRTKYGLAMLRQPEFVVDGLTAGAGLSPQIAILAQARHRNTARAFAAWMSDGGEGCAGCEGGPESAGNGLSKSAQAAEAVATDGLTRLVRGGGLGADADPEMAVLSPQLARRVLMTTAGYVASEAAVHVDTERVATDGALAVVALRVVASSERVFGVVHPLVVLRKGSDGKWRVLQVSLNLPAEEQQAAASALMASDPPSQTEERAGVKGVSLAAPVDGSQSGPMPALWWDNRGGAGLQVVEWEISYGGDWLDSRLYLVPDSASRLRTQVTARFAEAQGRYRWRVWSVGAAGEMKISPWRTFSVAR